MKSRTFKETEIGGIPEDWEVMSLKEVSTDVSYGYTASAKSEKVGPKFLRITDIVPYFVNWETVPYCEINKKDAEKYALRKGDIVVARTGANTGFSSFIKISVNAVFASYLIRFRIDRRKADPFFIGYILKSELWKNFVDGIIGGSAQPGVNAKRFGEFMLPVPTLEEQSSIAKILSDLDAKIELNRQMNDTFEHMTDALFKHWFVDFEFPNNEGRPYKSSGGKMVYNEEFGKEMPEGWGVGVFGDLVKNIKEPLHAGESIKNRVYAPIDSIPMRKLVIDRYKSYREAQSSLIAFEKGDILFGAMRAYFHRVTFSPFTGVTRTTTFVLRPKKKEYLSYALLTLNQDESVAYADSQSKGTTMPYAVWENSLEQMPIMIPDETVIAQFNEITERFLYLMTDNILQNITLNKIRDSLLPKLMSGKIRVPIEVRR